MPLRLLFLRHGERLQHLRKIARSPCRWASLVTFGWAISLWHDTAAAVHFAGVELIIQAIGVRFTSALMMTFAVMPLAAIFIPWLWVRLLATTLPMTWWFLILFQSLKTVGIYVPAVWTMILCILSLVHTEIKRASSHELE